MRALVFLVTVINFARYLLYGGKVAAAFPSRLPICCEQLCHIITCCMHACVRGEMGFDKAKRTKTLLIDSMYVILEPV